MSAGKCSSNSLRSPWRRHKNLVLCAAFLVVGVYVWAQYVEMDEAFSPLRPLVDAESEARRLLAIMTHYNYQCNFTLSQVGNATQWPMCASREIGFNADDKKIAYTIGSLPEYSLEKALAINYSFEVSIVSRASISPNVHLINNTRIIRMTVVANDPADFSRNSYTQRTLNDLLESDGRTTSRIDLLRLVSSERDLTQMWELLRYLINDGILLRVQQLHLLVNIEKLDEEYLYNWYRTLYELFSKSGLLLYHTSSHDPLCLQVTLMQSCVYFLAYARVPGPHIFSMYPPAETGTVEQEWHRLVDYINTLQVECNPPSGDESLRADTLWRSCVDDAVTEPPCKAIKLSSTSLAWSNAHASSTSKCQLINLTPVVQGVSETSVNGYLLQSRHSPVYKSSKSQAVDKTWQVVRSLGWLSAVDVDVPGHEWTILEQLLENSILQNASRLLLRIRLPNTEQLGATDLRNIYSQLRRVGSVGFDLFHSSDLLPCRSSEILSDTFVKKVASFGTGSADQCFRLGYLRSRFV